MAPRTLANAKAEEALTYVGRAKETRGATTVVTAEPATLRPVRCARSLFVRSPVSWLVFNSLVR